MTQTAKTFVFVMDPIESIDIRSDTTFVIMLEAQRRGHTVLYAAPEDLSVEGGGVLTARVWPVTLRREPGNHVDRGAARSIALDEEADVVMQRVDPPVDAAYITATQMLALCASALVLNRPAGILASNEKLYALNFPDLMPVTHVTRSIPNLLEFLAKLGGEMIVKPLDGKGGEGIFHVRAGDPNVSSILEQSTRFGERPVMAQEYLPQIRGGDKRILLVDGAPIGAVLRVPADDEVRANFHVGGRAARAEIDEDDRRIIERLAARLRADGLFFVGIDVIGGRLTEINVTSPTGVQEINALENRCLEGEILDGILRELSARRAGR